MRCYRLHCDVYEVEAESPEDAAVKYTEYSRDVDLVLLGDRPYPRGPNDIIDIREDAGTVKE